MLKDETAQKYGLGTDAVPDDVFSFLGRYNQYWWRRTAQETGYAMNISGEQAVVLCRVETPGSVSYSDEINFNNETGTISLVSPQTATVTYVGTTDSGIAFLRGKYFSTAGKFYYASPTANYYVDQYQPNSPYGIYAGEVIAEEVNTGEVDYVYSADRNAYPDSGESGGYEYQYIGVPFENAIEAPKIATGSYVGTGTYGQNNPNTLTFDFSPYLILIYGILQSKSNGVDSGYTLINKATGTFNSLSVDGKEIYFTYGNATFNGGMVSWYGTSSVSTGAAQANNSNEIYYYIAIGTGGGGN